MIKPFLFRILVKPFKLEDFDPVYKAASMAGIQMPKMQERIREEQAVDRGTVLFVGPQAFKEWTSEDVIAVGDDVFFAKYAGKRLKDPYTGEEVLALNDEDIIAGIYKE